MADKVTFKMAKANLLKDLTGFVGWGSDLANQFLNRLGEANVLGAQASTIMRG